MRTRTPITKHGRVLAVEENCQKRAKPLPTRVTGKLGLSTRYS